MTVRTRGQGTSVKPLIRVSRPIYEQLLAIQQAYQEASGRPVTFAEVIERLLADRKPVQP